MEPSSLGLVLKVVKYLLTDFTLRIPLSFMRWPVGYTGATIYGE